MADEFRPEKRAERRTQQYEKTDVQPERAEKPVEKAAPAGKAPEKRASDDRSDEVRQCMELLGELETAISESKSYMFGHDMKIVNGSILLDKLYTVKKLLPGSVKTAVGIVGEAEAIRSRASEEARAMREAAKRDTDRLQADIAAKQSQAATDAANAQQQTQQMIAQANAQAQQMLQQATAQANQMVQQAQYQAQQIGQQIVDQAHMEAEQLKSQEQVYQAALQDADRIRRECENSCNELRRRTYDYMDGMIGQLEGFVGSMLADVHQEREGLLSRRSRPMTTQEE